MYLTIGEVAARLRVRPGTVRWLIRSEQLTALRIDEELLIEKSDLAAFIDASVVRPRAACAHDWIDGTMKGFN